MSTLIKCQSPVNSLASLFDNIREGSILDSSHRNFSISNMPEVDIREDKKQFILKADLPGMEKKDVRIAVEDGALKIEGEFRNEYKKEEGKYHYFERSTGKFSRAFTLPEDVDAESIKATMKNGVLELTLPKTEKAQSKTIEVKVL